jgi:ATP-binding cassette subfamily C (CFTR/MRP) protein 2
VKSRDQRMKATNEVLNNMKIIKLQAWDEKFQKRVEEARSVEKGWASMFIYISGLNLCSLWLAPIAATIATFILRIYLNGDLSPGSVFTAVATFRLLQEPMRLFPQALMSISQALVSVDRLNRFMQSDELQEDAVERVAAGAEVAVCVESGTFKWEPDAELPTLRNVDIEIKKGSLVAIVGMVGSGKSTLLASLLGEVPRVAGKVQVSGSIAYVAQTAWIQNGTIQDNILFGRPMDHRQYHETLRVCCLTVDLLQMESGDQTEIGERGINLSGGQKQRIQLARAVYQDADIYLLDDVFSAVDAHTGSELFKECVMGALKGKTTLLVTHQVDFLHGADNILVLRDGEIVQSGRYNELLNAGMDFAMLVDAHNEAMDMVGLDDSDVDVDDPQMPLMSQPLNIGTGDGLSAMEMSRNTSSSMGRESSLKTGPPNSESISLLERNLSRNLSRNGGSRRDSMSLKSSPGSWGSLERKYSQNGSTQKKDPLKLIEAEERAKGRVSLKVYWMYITKVYGGALVLVLVLNQGIWQTLQIAADYWLAYETSDANKASFNAHLFLFVYSSISFGSLLCALVRALTVAFVGVRTAQSFYLKMLQSIFRAPMSFFDTTPTGRIITRSLTDQSAVDIYLPFFLGIVLNLASQTLGILFVTSRVTWQVAIVIVPLMYIYITYQVCCFHLQSMVQTNQQFCVWSFFPLHLNPYNWFMRCNVNPFKNQFLGLCSNTSWHLRGS